jgi:hypothetical protein
MECRWWTNWWLDEGMTVEGLGVRQRATRAAGAWVRMAFTFALAAYLIRLPMRVAKTA